MSLLLLTPPDLWAQKQTPPPPGIPRNFALPETRTFTLPNGLQVTLVPFGAVPKTWIQLVVRTGNASESPSEVSLATFVSVFMQEGTTTRTAMEIAGDAAGMGGRVDVSVDMDETTISGNALSEFAPGMAGLIADVVRNPAFPESELARLKMDFRRNLSQARARPVNVAYEKFVGTLYPNHPYGRVFSTDAMLNSFTIAQVRTFYASSFGAGRAHMYVSGKFDQRAIEAAIRSAFGGWQRGTPATVSIPKAVKIRSIHLIDRPGSIQSTVWLGLPVLDPSSPDYPGLIVTDALVGGTWGSRIFRNIRENKGYTYSPASEIANHHRDTYWVQTADVTTDVTGASLKEIFFEIEHLRADQPSIEELRGMQNYVAGLFVRRNSTQVAIINQLRFIDLHGLGRDYLENFVKRVHALTQADITRIAHTYLRPDQMTLVVVGDKSKVASQLVPYGLRVSNVK